MGHLRQYHLWPLSNEWPIASMDWQQALSYCESLIYCGSDDWRLPTVKELISLTSYGRTHPASEFPGTWEQWGYFSSTSKISYDYALAMTVHYNEGNVLNIHKHNDSSVFCVRYW